MAKNTVNVDVRVDDKGSLKKVAKSAQSARRQIGGAAKTAGAGGKQFSKMSQGITGGLVPAYAQLAATLFAVDALFRALKESSELRVQREGMIAYSNATGTAMQSVARNLQAATDAQLSFKDAASASAIGLAAGLNADQMNEIGKAAKNASIALGRNFTDSFDRVLKGIVKGEPELLDELGIILRLDTATRKYADAMNVAQEDLTAFQRSQAVYNEVIGQAEDKYSAMAESVDVSAVQQLATALEDVKNAAMEALAPIVEFLAGVFSGNLTAVIALLLVFASSIMSKILPSLGELKNQLVSTGSAFKTNMGGAWTNIKSAGSDVKGAYKTATASPAQLAKRTTSAASALGPTKSVSVQALADGKKLSAAQLGQTKAMLKRAELEWKKTGKITTGAMAGQNIKKVRNLSLAIGQMNNRTRSLWTTVVQTGKLMAHSFKGTMMLMVNIARAGYNGMKLAAKGFAFVANTAMKAAGFIGMAMMIFQVFEQLKSNIDKIYKWIGSALQKLSDVFKMLAEKMKATGLFYFHGKALEKLSEKAAEAAVKFTEMGEAQVDLKEAERKAKTLADSIAEIGKSAKKSTEELNKMLLKRRELAKDRPETDSERLMINSNSAKTGGATAVSLLKNLGDISGGDKTEALNEIGELLLNLRDVDEGYMKLATALTMGGANMDDSAIAQMITDLQLLNTKSGAGGASITAVVQEVESLGKSLKDLGTNSKGYTETMVNSLIKMAPEFKNLNTESQNLVDGPLRAYLTKIIGKDAAAGVKTTADALAIVNSKLTHHQQILTDIRKDEIAAMDNKIFALGSAGRGAAMKGEIAFLSKVSDLTRDISEAKQVEAQAAEKLLGYKGTETDYQDVVQDLALAKKKVEYTNAALEAEKKAYSVIGQMQVSIENHFTKMFEDLATGAATLGQALKKLFSSILMDLARILAKQAAIKAMSMVFGLEDGGITGLAKGGVIPRYSSGGIATEPTYLVGEGRHNEAVVPLPNGRSIPVDMKGASGTSNITVNVSASGGQTTTSAGAGEKERKLGQMVAAAVQGEILDQQRPGGLLSQYGDGDI